MKFINLHVNYALRRSLPSSFSRILAELIQRGGSSAFFGSRRHLRVYRALDRVKTVSVPIKSFTRSPITCDRSRAIRFSSVESFGRCVLPTGSSILYLDKMFPSTSQWAVDRPLIGPIEFRYHCCASQFPFLEDSFSRSSPIVNFVSECLTSSLLRRLVHWWRWTKFEYIAEFIENRVFESDRNEI